MMPEREPQARSVSVPAAATAVAHVGTADRLPTAAAEHRHVFVYGTLRAGGSNDITRHRPSPQWIGQATVAATLYDFGGWPGLRLVGDSLVVGEVWRIDPSIEPLLDRLEGVREDGSGEYLKRSLSLLVGGSPVSCLVYEISADRLAGRPVIQGGDWIAYCASRPPPLITSA